MKTVIRHSVFETNSSSTHSLSIRNTELLKSLIVNYTIYPSRLQNYVIYTGDENWVLVLNNEEEKTCLFLQVLADLRNNSVIEDNTYYQCIELLMDYISVNKINWEGNTNYISNSDEDYCLYEYEKDHEYYIDKTKEFIDTIINNKNVQIVEYFNYW